MPTARIELAAGTYDYDIDGTPGTVTIPTLTSGSIDQASPTIGDTLTVSGSNASATATFQWQESADGSTGWTNISGATSASLDTSSGVTDDYYVRRQVSDGAQGPASTAGVQVAAAAAFTAPVFDQTLLDSAMTETGGYNEGSVTLDAGDYIVVIFAATPGTASVSEVALDPAGTKITASAISGASITTSANNGGTLAAFTITVPSSATYTFRATMSEPLFGRELSAAFYKGDSFQIISATTEESLSNSGTAIDLDQNTQAGDAIYAFAMPPKESLADVGTTDGWTPTAPLTQDFDEEHFTRGFIFGASATGVSANSPQTIRVTPNGANTDNFVGLSLVARAA